MTTLQAASTAWEDKLQVYRSRAMQGYVNMRNSVHNMFVPSDRGSRTKPFLNDQDRKSIVIGGWLVGAISLGFSQRYIVVDLGFTYPLTLLAWQAFVVIFITKALQLHNLLLQGRREPENEVEISWPVYTTFIVPIGFLQSLSPICVMVVSQSMPLAVLIAVLSTLPLAVGIVGRGIGIRQSSHKLILVGMIVVALLWSNLGALKAGSATAVSQKQTYGTAWMYTTYGPGQLNNVSASLDQSLLDPEQLSVGAISMLVTRASNMSTPASAPLPKQVMPADILDPLMLFVALIAVLAEALAISLTERIVRDRNEKVPISDLVHHAAPISLLTACLGVFFIERPDLRMFFTLPSGILIANGLAAMLVVYSVPAVIQMICGSTYALADAFRKMLIVYLACVTYNIRIGTFSAALSFIGFAIFLKVTEREHAGKLERIARRNLVSKSTNESTSVDDFEQPDEGLRDGDDEIPEELPSRSDSNLLIMMSGLLIAVLVMASSATNNALDVMSSNQGAAALQASLPYESRKLATIIEVRNLPHLGALLLSFLSVLPLDWPMLAWVSPENIEVLRASPSILRNIESGRLTLQLFPHQFDTHNQEYFSRFLTKPTFWELLDAEWILFFQSDSILCSRSPQHIDDWIGYDWVGAPWGDNPNAQGGNGGLSIRKRSSMLKLTRNASIARPDGGDPEDVWFSHQLKNLPGVRWPAEHQAHFSVENHFGEMGEWAFKPFGVHSGGNPPGTWRDPGTMNRMMDWCPELKLFYDPVKWLTAPA